MANKIKVQPSDLRSQADKLASCAGNDLYSIIQKTNKAVLLMEGALEGKFVNNMHVKSSSVRNQYSELLNHLANGALALRQCAETFGNTDADLTKELDRILADMPDVCYAPSSYNTNSTNTMDSNEVNYENYRDLTNAITKLVPIGQNQETQVTGDGMCTYSATTTLLKRKQAAEGKDVTFSFSDVHRVNGGTGVKDTNGKWSNSSFAWTRTYTADDGSSYTMKHESGKKSPEEIINLLNDHPEGIILYSTYGTYTKKDGTTGYNRHAIVITDYELNSDGSIQFFADDPVSDRDGNKGRIKIEETWLYSKTKEVFENAFVWAYF